MSLQYYDIILKNTTPSGISIRDMAGLTVPASGTVDVTDLFPFHKLVMSDDIDQYVTNSGIVLNVEGTDLSVDEARVFLSHHNATHIQGIPIGSPGQEGPEVVAYSGATASGVVVLKYTPEDNRVGMEELDFLDLGDTPTTYSGQSGKSAIVNDSGDGLIFNYPTTATGVYPPIGGGNLWYNEVDHQLYYWDADRLDWLSIMSHYYIWTGAGAHDGTYMAIGNITHDSAYYFIPKASTIISVASSAQKANNSTKGFEIETTASGTILMFSHVDWLYEDDQINVRLDPGDEMKCYVDNIGQAVKNAIVTLEIKWRHEGEGPV